MSWVTRKSVGFYQDRNCIFPQTFKPNKWESNDGGDSGGNRVLIEKWVWWFFVVSHSIVLNFVFLFICFSFLLFTTSSLLLVGRHATLDESTFWLWWKFEIFYYFMYAADEKRDHEVPITQLVNWRWCLLQLFSESAIILTFL